GREHQDLDLRVLRHDPPRGLDAVEVRHLDVHQDDVRLQRLAELDGFQAVDRLADDRHACVDVEQPGESGPEERLVVGDEYTGGARGRRSLVGLLDGDAQIRFSFFKIARMMVPRPATLSTSSRPPRMTARSCIPSKPKPGLRCPSIAAPRPLSLTSMAMWLSSAGPNATSTSRAPLCSRTLLSASSMMR